MKAKQLTIISAIALMTAKSAFATDAKEDFVKAISTFPLLAQSKPAVDGVNGKLQIYGGADQDNSNSISGISGLSPIHTFSTWKGMGGAVGTLTLPLGHSFGAQIDLGPGVFGSSPLGSAAGHLFWRDPDKGMVGIYGDGLLLGSKDSSAAWTAAGEFEAFLGKFTGRMLIGIQGFNSYPAGGLSSYKEPDYFHDFVEATFYPIDDLAISAGHIYSFGRNALTAEIEYMPPEFRGGDIAASFFASGVYGWNSSSNIMAGIRIYFGNHDKTLIRRQREDDPKVRRAFHSKYRLLQSGGANPYMYGVPASALLNGFTQGHLNIGQTSGISFRQISGNSNTISN